MTDTNSKAQVTDAFQDRVQPWMMACFGPEISADKLERGDRLVEELFELLQSVDYPRERIRALEDYTWSRPKGEPHQEAGGVMVTFAAYCLAHKLDMHQAGEDELARIWTKVETIRAKQAAKPTGSALPIPALAAQEKPEPGVAVPAGWKLVPIVPTMEMILNASRDHEGEPWLPHSLWTSMLDASPSPIDKGEVK